MKKPNLIIELLKFFGAFLIGLFLFLFIFAAFKPKGSDGIPDPFGQIALVLSILVAILFTIITNFNKLRRLKETAEESYSNISINTKRAEKLLSQANRVIDKYINHESDIQTTVAQYRSGFAHGQAIDKVKTSADFQAVLENYPNLKANESIQQLLQQIVDSENIVSNSKMRYNNITKEYNFFIKSFPTNLMRRLWKLKQLEYYTEPEVEVTDEMLGL